MEVTFYGTYDKQMFLDALSLTEKKSALNTALRFLALGLFLFIIGASLYAWFIEGVDQSRVPRLIRSLITALLIGYYYFSPILARRRAVASLFRSGPERTMQGNANLEGIDVGPRDNRATIKWDRFISKGEKDKLSALMTVEGFVAVFHRDFFATESDWQRFRHMVNQRVVEPK
jgi:hypothetical protein